LKFACGSALAPAQLLYIAAEYHGTEGYNIHTAYINVVAHPDRADGSTSLLRIQQKAAHTYVRLLLQ
jgi:hypothetical protein